MRPSSQQAVGGGGGGGRLEVRSFRRGSRVRHGCATPKKAPTKAALGLQTEEPPSGQGHLLPEGGSDSKRLLARQ